MATRKQLNEGSMNTPIYQWYGKDGRAYDTKESAQAADRAFDLATGQTVNPYSLEGNRTYQKIIGGQSSQSNYTQEFLKKWGEISDKALETLQMAITGGTSTGNEQSDALIKDISTRLTDFDTTYGGMTKEAVTGAMGDIATKRGLVGDLAGMAKADYAGVAGRAASDVTGQSAQERESMAREAMSYGVDPTSGKFGVLTKKSYMDEARNKVVAMNLARRGEKERSTAATATAAGLINPSESANIASMLMGKEGQLLGMKTDVFNAQTAAENARAGSLTSIANVMGDIGEQYGSLGSTMLGLEEAREEPDYSANAANIIANRKTATGLVTPTATTKQATGVNTAPNPAGVNPGDSSATKASKEQYYKTYGKPLQIGV